ncbi:class I SAM-dependent methyltransferase [Rhizomonospora bruguierae]|uniref:class I SAM-dependent methyltransferase n=1 Tax=Rhizomonospora bruguierae TaxID=1581705 RepID=UPI001BD149C2|nr:class I SAM-dependent methyltransferase [Micromonospora sp. NBRC 107566]
MTAPGVFDAAAGTYDQARRRLVPCFDDFYGTAVDLAVPPLRAAAAAGRTPRVLDLGAGTGLVSVLVGTAVPGARVTLLDGAPAMLAVAVGHLSARGIDHEIHVADLCDPLPPGPYDAVVSALAIHHLDDAGKRDLYRRVREALVPGGVFVNAEQVAGPTPALDRRYHEVWLAQIGARGSDAAEIAAARERMSHDRPAPVRAQCDWLRDLGYAEVDTVFKAWRFAVFTGTNPSA